MGMAGGSEERGHNGRKGWKEWQRVLVAASVPINDAEAATQDASSLPPQEISRSRRRANEGAPSILLVEDDAGIRAAMCQLLRDEGYTVETADDGLSALQQLRSQVGIGLVILDVRMPVMNGWEFRLAQRADARLSSIPVIAVSADISPQAMAIDADLHFKKPFDPQQLLAGVQRLLWQSEKNGMQARLDEAERLASLGRVVAGVGHEINNPLAYVTLNIEALREALREAQQDPRKTELDKLVSLVSDCETGLERIRQVVGNLRSLSRQSEMLNTFVAVDEILDQARSMVANQIQQRASLIPRYARLPAVFGHPGRLGQVFVNLLVNAAQSLPAGQQDRNQITISATADARRVVVEIRDTGPGIPGDVLPRVFEPFFTTRHDEDGGTGLGLSISCQIVLAHGGDLTLESVLGQGTVARVSLPVARPAAGQSEQPRPVMGQPAPASAPAAAQAPVAPARGRILIVDDDPLVSRALCSLLRREHDVVEKGGALEALELLRSGQVFDVILCDVLMPDMDGAAFHEELEKSLPRQAEQLVFMTGGAFTPRASAFVDRVPRPVVAKPFDAVKLRSLVRDMVRVRREATA